jgi:DNA helicase HerA-like ATPase
MNNSENFISKISTSYSFEGKTILIGGAILTGNETQSCPVRIPLRTLNRHGLIAGATGTGKTKSLQVLAESLSDAGVPVLLMDIKGDLSGIAKEGMINKHIERRRDIIGMAWEGKRFPVELMSISKEPGIRLRATVSEFGPVLLGKILDLKENQSGVLSLIFKFCDDKHLPLLDLKDLQSVLKYIQEEGRDEFLKEYGHFQAATAGTILRQIVQLEQQGADEFFGEPSFDVADLRRADSDGKGYINVIRLTDMQTRPALFSTFMLCLLAEIYEKFPEKGDSEKPELIIFIDEAHLVFDTASKTLTDQLEMIVKLIRSKGVGVFFVTQSPDDIPASILGQLGLKVQHALRAFTAKDRKAIKTAAENYPVSEFYKTDEVITRLGIGEALVTAIDEQGRPTELAYTLMRPPYSRMDILTPDEINGLVSRSQLANKYNQEIDRNSAYEILHQRLVEKETYPETEMEKDVPQRSQRKPVKEPDVFEDIMKSPVTRTIARELTRGLFGVLGLSSSPKRRSGSSRRSSPFNF